MTRQYIEMMGMPYFPGVAMGRMQRGASSDNTAHIALLTQAEICMLETVPAGVIVVEGAPFSHALITLLGLGVPTVLISAQQAESLQDGMMLYIDGISGRISDDLSALPTPAALHSPHQPGEKLFLADGEAVNLYASVRQPMATRRAAQLGAQAIGLVRTEYLLPPHEQLPDTAFYCDTFRSICEAASPLPVTFRLLDVAADKIPAWFPHNAGVGRPLGLQGVRLYKLDPVANVVDAQLTALAQLADEFSLRVLIPFLVQVEEFVYWRDQIRQRLPAHVAVGAMAETLASVLDITSLLQCADFVAIGCNDLMQSLYATDRDLAELRHYLDPYAPVLFRLLHQVAEQADGQLEHIQLCGVLSQLQGIFPVLLGLGYRTFSVDAPFIPYLATVATQTTRSACENLAQQVCAANTTQDVLTILRLPVTNRVTEECSS